MQGFVDCKPIKVRGGKGGDGCVSFLSLFMNDCAGPDGGDGGCGGHVILEVCISFFFVNCYSRLSNI